MAAHATHSCLSQISSGKKGRRDENSCWEAKDSGDDKENPDLL